MNDENTKSHFVGMRVTKEKSELLADTQQKTGMSKSDVLLRGLELVAEFYSLGLDSKPLSRELKELEDAAKYHAENLMRIKSREKAIREMIRELREVDEIIDRHGAHPGSLIQILLDLQEQMHWLPKHALVWISERLRIPVARIYQMANFYDAFSLAPRGKHLVQVCEGSACYMLGSQQLLTRISQVLGIQPNETDADLQFTLTTVHCLGCCALGPVVKIDKDYYSNPDAAHLTKIFSEYREKRMETVA
jgi:NADH-quinone oxidoreductase subunit E